jgi:hypothetical protein
MSVMTPIAGETKKRVAYFMDTDLGWLHQSKSKRKGSLFNVVFL